MMVHVCAKFVPNNMDRKLFFCTWKGKRFSLKKIPPKSIRVNTIELRRIELTLIELTQHIELTLKSELNQHIELTLIELRRIKIMVAYFI